MSDLASAAREFVDALERGNVDAYADSLAEWVLDWTRRGEWPRFAGPGRRVVEVVTDERWPTRAAVVMDGGDRTMALRVHFDTAGKVSGFGLAEWPLESAFRNIVISCPRDSDLRRRMEQLYRALRGRDAFRPVLNFRGLWVDERPPRWPDPNSPQHLHLDLFAADLELSEEIAIGHGATRVQATGDHRIYRDLVGHVFCMYPDDTVTQDAVIGRVVMDCPTPRTLARFYADLLGMETVEDSAERVVIAYADGRLPMLGFQHVPGYVAPRWQDPEHPSQIHLDLHFEDHDDAVARAEGLGAVPLPDGGSCPVYADPAGHPFCLCSPGS